MAANPRIVTEDTVFTWDGVEQRIAKGTPIDVPPGSALEAAIGEDRLVPVFRAGSTALPPEPAAGDEGKAAAPRKKAAQALAGAGEKDAA